jgi:hypothetical protein
LDKYNIHKLDKEQTSYNGIVDAFRLALIFYKTKAKDIADSVIINIKGSGSTAEKYFCSYCNTRLTPFTEEDRIGGYLCTKCTIEYWPKQQPVKKQSKFDLPGPPTDSHGNIIGNNDIPIAVIDDINKVSSTTYKKQKLTAAYEALQKQGFNFTNYEER